MVVVVVVVLGAVLVTAIVVLSMYNRFVRQRQLVANAWANVETELRRRYDLVPNLVETVKGYAAHERATFEAVTRARATAVANHGDAAAQAGDENLLVGALRQLLAVSEAYPALQADTQYLSLQQELVATENRIQAARRFYNNNVRSLNTRVQTVPSNLVARAFGFREAAYFEIDEMAATPPSVDFGPER
ncbi:MAG: LemA family protein [Acidimicrobiales bacterium]|nr:LemA family protein [Acidimicrobiales bacterium]